MIGPEPPNAQWFTRQSVHRAARQALCGAAILAGVGVALMPKRNEEGPAHGVLAGTLFGLLDALCQAWGAVLSRKAYAVAAAQEFAISGVSGGVNAAYQRLWSCPSPISSRATRSPGAACWAACWR